MNRGRSVSTTSHHTSSVVVIVVTGVIVDVRQGGCDGSHKFLMVGDEGVRWAELGAISAIARLEEWGGMSFAHRLRGPRELERGSSGPLPGGS